MHARQRVGAVVVVVALILADALLLEHASAFIRIAGHSLRTHAFVAAVLVDALRSVRARIAVRRALVLIEAALERVALESDFAHALRRIGRRALRIDAARISFAWILALIAVARVQEEWRRTHALARLHTLLVRAALLVGCASSLRRRTLAVIGVAVIAHRAQALVRAGLVDALGAEAAEMLALSTLVDVDARAVRLRAIAFGTRAVADAAGDGHAFGAGRTLAAVLASGQNATAAHEFVRRLALALCAAALLANHVRVAVEAVQALALIAAG